MKKNIESCVYGELIDGNTGKKLKAKAKFINGALVISVEGYGDLTSVAGEGEPVIMDYYENELRVIVWGDINKVDATNRISLEGAKESERWEIDDQGNCKYCGKQCFDGEMCDEQQAGGFNIADIEIPLARKIMKLLDKDYK